MVHFPEINQAPSPFNVAAYRQSSNTEACPEKLSQILANNNVSAYWQSSNTKACAKKLSQVLANNNVWAYWQSSNTEACTKKLSQILANNIDNGGRELLSEFMWGIVGFEYLSSRRWLRKLCSFYRIVRNKSPSYLCKYILPGNRAYRTRKRNNIKQIFCR